MKLENGVLTNVQNRDIPKRGKITAKWIGWNGVTRIGYSAFAGCGRFTSITIVQDTLIGSSLLTSVI